MFHERTLFRKTEAALLEEKANKLFGLARLLDARLTEPLAVMLDPDAPAPEDRSEAVAKISRALAPIADEIAAAFPGVGAGYYALSVDGIVAYAPSQQFGDKVGISVWPDHIGRRAMRERREMVAVGSMVRGDIMNCVRPLIRAGRVIGFVWANEAIEDIYRQLQESEEALFFSGNHLEALLGLTGLLVLCSRQLGLIRRILDRSAARGRQADGRNLTDALGIMRRYLEMFLNTLDSALLVFDREGRVIFGNTRALALLNRDLGPDIFLWETLAAMGWPDLRPQVEEMCREKLGHLPLKFSIGEAGREVDLHLVRLEEKEPYFLLVVDDLNAVRAREDYQWRAAKLAAAGEMAVAIAHEIRNPLAIIRGSVRLLPEKLNDREFLLRLAEVLQCEIDHVNSTLEALLAFTRIAEPTFETVNLSALLAGTAALIEPYASGHGVQVVLEHPDGDLLIQGDARYLRQAFLNLMINAVQAMPNGGTLSIACHQRQGSNLVDVVVKDTGVGIPSSDLSKVFDIFFTRRPGGVGLGLALVQRIIDQHQGFIRLESEVGRGTTFVVTLPVRPYSFKRG